MKCEFSVKQTDHHQVENPPVDMQNGYIILKVFHRTSVRRFFPAYKRKKKGITGWRNTHRHVHAFALSVTAATVSDSEMMTHSGIQFHVLEPTGTLARTRAK